MVSPPLLRRHVHLTEFSSSDAGLYQAIYTVIVLLAFAAISQSYHLCLLWQFVKLASSVHYGSREICEKTPRRAIIKVWQQRCHGQ